MMKNALLSICSILLFSESAPVFAESDPNKNNPIPVMIDVPETTFLMGRDPVAKGESDELPQHSVTLSQHQIGKYEVTNAQYAAVLNWANEQGYIQSDPFKPFAKKPENIFLNGRLLKIINEETQIILDNGRYIPIMRDGIFMDDHPVVDITWSGAIAYANWLSEIQELTPCYDLKTFKRIMPATNGYRLPTEAEWEHAAGWSNTPKNIAWNYAASTDTLTEQQGNFQLNNPLASVGFTTYPFTSSIGYFDGTTPSTLDSTSPIGCYDMSGNVQEWCEDWFSIYTPDAKLDPVGPESGSFKIVRGGAWNSMKPTCRTTNRGWTEPSNHYRSFGFRIARSLPKK